MQTGKITSHVDDVTFTYKFAFIHLPDTAPDSLTYLFYLIKTFYFIMAKRDREVNCSDKESNTT